MIDTASGDDSTDTPLRYAAYANRLRSLLLTTHRYVAYTSDIGESFRPVAHPYLVTSCYGISWAYLLGDVGYQTWKARLKQSGCYRPGLKPWDKQPSPDALLASQYKHDGWLDWKILGFKRALFQGVASMGLPAITIHSIVKWTGVFIRNRGFKGRIWTLMPVVAGLAVVPALPYLFDEPVEKALDYGFERAFGNAQDKKD
ncbi:hypothetical protein DAMA08_024680 [Martiniozyma asiatica (nom. inval.)]|nr:hypothetical protein DAMA08_024680 [Martiniozyma asiatica]